MYQPYASVEALSAYLGAPLPPDAPALLRDASDDLDAHISAPFTTHPDTGLPVNALLAVALSDACVRQVAYMLEVGVEVGLVRAPRTKGYSTGKYSQNWQPGVLGPRARSVLHRTGFLTVR